MTNTAPAHRHNVDAIIGDNIHRLMWLARKTQTETAISLGMTQGALSRKLRGERPWYADEIMAASVLFQRDVGDLFKLLPDHDSNVEPADIWSAAEYRLTQIASHPRFHGPAADRAHVATVTALRNGPHGHYPHNPIRRIPQ